MCVHKILCRRHRCPRLFRKSRGARTAVPPLINFTWKMISAWEVSQLEHSESQTNGRKRIIHYSLWIFIRARLWRARLYCAGGICIFRRPAVEFVKTNPCRYTYKKLFEKIISHKNWYSSKGAVFRVTRRLVVIITLKYFLNCAIKNFKWSPISKND